MSGLFTWFIRDRLGPISSSDIAETIGLSLAPNILIGYHVVAPLDAHGLVDRFTIFSGHSERDTLLNSLTTDASLWCSREQPHSLVIFSRRSHDIIDERDEEEVLFTAAWLASEGVHLLDWYVVTRLTTRSIPADFGLPRGW